MSNSKSYGDEGYDGYWAADTNKNNFANRMLDRFEKHQQTLKRTKRHDRIVSSVRGYNGQSRNGSWDCSEVQTGGQRGELAMIKPNEFRSFIQQILVMATQAPPAYEPRATNNDARSEQQAMLSRGILDYFQEDAGLRDVRRMLGEVALVMSESWVTALWDPTAGKKREDLERAQPGGGVSTVTEGDFNFYITDPYDTAVDPHAPDQNDPPWTIVRLPFHRWDMVAQYGGTEGEDGYDKDVAEALENANGWGTDNAAVDWEFFQQLGDPDGDERGEEDYIAGYWLFHKPTPAMPQGRESLVFDVEVRGEKFVAVDGGLSYKRTPTFRCVQNEVVRGSGGYTVAFDLLAMHDAMGSVATKVMSILERSGPVIATPAGSNFKVNDLQFAKQFEWGGGAENKPFALDLFKISGDHFGAMEWMRSTMSRLTAVPDDLRGDPSSGESGTARATTIAAASQYNQGFQRSLRSADAALATHMIHTLQSHAETDRVVSIMGRRGSSLHRSYSPTNDLNQIEYVYVQPSDPFRDTHQGRMQFVQMAKDNNLIQGPGDLWEALTTGRLEPLYEDQVSEELYLRHLQEILADANQPIPPVSPADNFPEHIKAARGVLHNFSSRFDQQLTDRVGQYIMAVDEAWAKANPGTLMVLGIPTHPLMGGPAPGGPPPGAQQGPPGPPQAGPPPGPDGPPQGPIADPAQPGGMPGAEPLPPLAMNPPAVSGTGGN